MSTATCEYKKPDGTLCGESTQESFAFGGRLYYFCEDHLLVGAEQVTGRKFKNK